MIESVRDAAVAPADVRVYQGWLDKEVGKLIEMARRPSRAERCP